MINRILILILITVAVAYGRIIEKVESTKLTSDDDHKILVEILQKVSSLESKTNELEKRLSVVETDIKKLIECSSILSKLK